VIARGIGAELASRDGGNTNGQMVGGSSSQNTCDFSAQKEDECTENGSNKEGKDSVYSLDRSIQAIFFWGVSLSSVERHL
jgi:hypothetical protein